MVRQSRAWFTSRYFGRGWYPSSWEGWAVSFTYILLSSLLFLAKREPYSIVIIGILTVAFLYICTKKGRQPNPKVDGKEKDWRAGKIG